MGEAPPDAAAGERTDAAPHGTSIAVWGVPSPVVVGRRFAATIGVKCPAACSLAGRPVVVRDAAGAEVGRERLGSQPAPGTRALYAASVALAAPAEAGVHAWTAAFPAAASGAPPAAESRSAGPSPPETAASPEAPPPPDAPHAEARATFSFRAAAPPEHSVTVSVCDRATEAPLAAVEVHLGPYRAATDAEGRTRVDVPAGDYDLYVRKAGYAPHTGRVAVTGDVALQVAATPAPDVDPDDEQLWM